MKNLLFISCFFFFYFDESKTKLEIENRDYKSWESVLEYKKLKVILVFIFIFWRQRMIHFARETSEWNESFWNILIYKTLNKRVNKKYIFKIMWMYLWDFKMKHLKWFVGYWNCDWENNVVVVCETCRFSQYSLKQKGGYQYSINMKNKQSSWVCTLHTYFLIFYFYFFPLVHIGHQGNQIA